MVDRLRRHIVGQSLHALPQPLKMRDQLVTERHRISQRRQRVENVRHVMDVAAANEADPVVVEPAEFHGWTGLSTSPPLWRDVVRGEVKPHGSAALDADVSPSGRVKLSAEPGT